MKRHHLGCLRAHCNKFEQAFYNQTTRHAHPYLMISESHSSGLSRRVLLLFEHVSHVILVIVSLPDISGMVEEKILDTCRRMTSEIVGFLSEWEEAADEVRGREFHRALT